jgi:putative phosphoribosyl transferase
MFADRSDAGRRLALQLARLKGEQPVVLALPRGGVPVAAEVARSLEAPLDLVLVRKVGVPFQPELAAGAVVDGPEPITVWNEEILRVIGLTPEALADVVEAELAEIQQRRARYLADRPRPPIAGRTAIVVDDGIATGATVKAALRAVRRAGPRRVVLAVPVAPPEAIADLERVADEVVCLETPPDLIAIGIHYRDFSQVRDEEVVALLDACGAPDTKPRPASGTQD